VGGAGGDAVVQGTGGQTTTSGDGSGGQETTTGDGVGGLGTTTSDGAGGFGGDPSSSGTGGSGGDPTVTSSTGYAPGGSDASVQINDGGSLYGDDGFTYDKEMRSVSGGIDSSAPGPHSFAWGDTCTASGEQSFAGSRDATASGRSSFAWGYDVWTASTYGVSLGAHIDNMSVAAVSIGENLRNGPDSANAVEIGFQNTIGRGAPFSSAIGSYLNVADDAIGAFACGLSATASRPGQFQHSSGTGLFAGTAWIDLHSLAAGTPGALTDMAGRPFRLDAASYAVLTLELLAVTRNGAKRAFETRKIEALCSLYGVVTIVSDTPIAGEGNLEAQGWSLTIAPGGPHELTFAVDPGADTVAFGARLAWSQMGGTHVIP
jgi:hypothetical protein